MLRRLTFASVVGSCILVSGVFFQGNVPATSLRTPLDYGAIGDGVTNDTVALQRAIDATQNGGSLYFPGGYRFLVRHLVARGEIHWLGPGGSWLSDRAVDGAVLVQGDNADEDLLTLDHAPDSSIMGVGFDGNKSHQSKPCNGIRLINCEFTRLDNVYVTSCSGSGILFENSNTLQTSDEIDLVDCYSVLNGEDGVRFGFTYKGLWSPGDCEIIGGHYDFNKGDGINLHVSSYNAISGANVLSNGGAGIECTYCTGLNIASNMVRNNMKQGIVLGTGPQFSECTNCSIIGNQVHLNSREGVGKYSEVDVGFGSVNTRIIGNYCGDVHTSPDYPTSAKYGIWLHDGSKHTVVVGNACPASELVSGGFLAEPGATYSAVANTGVPDTYVAASTAPPKGQEFIASGGDIGTVQASSNSMVWVSLKGKRGGMIHMPPASAATSGQTFVLKDIGGAANSAPIEIDGNGAHIDGKPAIRLDKAFGSVRLRFEAGEWWSW